MGQYSGLYTTRQQMQARAAYTWPGLLDGSSSAAAATSAAAIKTLTGTNTDGVYWIDLPTVGPTQIYCIMDSAYDGGGWMMILKATTGTTFNYSANYWTTNNTLNPTDTTVNNADAKFNTFNYFLGKDFMARWPDITTGTGGSITGRGMWTWLQNDYHTSRTTPLNFFSNRTTMKNYTTSSESGSGNFFGAAKSYSGWASGTFSSQNAINYYGFNYENNTYWGTAAKVRWGFGWNENGEGNFPGGSAGGYAGSNDVSGGIGMDSSFGSFSAGDKVNCCQDSTGINRSARVEMYVR